MKHRHPAKRPRLILIAAAAFGFFLGFLSPARSAERAFPFDHELLLDAKPMRGSKRIPSLEIGPNGRTAIDLWCNSVEGQIVVVEDTITIMTGQKTDRACPAERAQGDEEMLAALSEVTNWRREGETLVLIGPKMLRFRPLTN
jgi:heat shock protein HslJ